MDQSQRRFLHTVVIESLSSTRTLKINRTLLVVHPEHLPQVSHKKYHIKKSGMSYFTAFLSSFHRLSGGFGWILDDQAASLFTSRNIAVDLVESSGAAPKD